MDRAMPRSVRGQSEHRTHRQQAAAMILGLERNTLETARLRLWQSVEIAEPGIGHRPIGIDESIHGQVLCEQFAEKLHRLGLDAGLQPRLVARVEFFVWREHADAVQLEPLPRKVIDEAVGFAVCEHPVHFYLEIFAVQRAALGRGEEAVVGHRTPEEI